jgi:hypothetical protein
MADKEKSFSEQIEDLKKEIDNLPEDKQDLAGKILESYAERVNNTNKLSKEIDDYIENNPEFNPLYITNRPEGLSYEAYKILRRASRKTIKGYIKHNKQKLVRLRKG